MANMVRAAATRRDLGTSLDLCDTIRIHEVNSLLNFALVTVECYDSAFHEPLSGSHMLTLYGSKVFERVMCMYSVHRCTLFSHPPELLTCTRVGSLIQFLVEHVTEKRIV